MSTNKRKVIFLDIDGVLNSDRSISAFSMRTIHPNNYRINYLISKADPVAVALLNKITDDTRADICISSANRLALPFDVLVDTLQKMGVTGNIIGSTASLNTIRGVEIETWLDDVGAYDEYVILDDSVDFLPHQMDNFVKVDAEMGLSRNNMLKAKQILGEEVSSLILP